VARCADQALDVGLHQELQHGFGHGAQKVAFTGLLHELGQCHPRLGHRVVLGWLKHHNSTLADRPDDHLARLPGGAPRQTPGRSLGAPPCTANFHHTRGR
jgi:hypothetical protein